jgi:hypothetical protein
MILDRGLHPPLDGSAFNGRILDLYSRKIPLNQRDARATDLPLCDKMHVGCTL